MKKPLAVLSIVAALSPFTAAQAGVITYDANKALTATNWSDVLTFNKFDTALGNLTSIKFDLVGTVRANGNAESMDGGPSIVTLTLGSLLSLTRPDSSTLVVTNPVFSQNFNFTSFDGLINFGGTSGGTTGTVSVSDMNSFVSYSANDFSLFSALGGGAINLGLFATGNSSGSGSGNLITQISTAAAGDIKVTYTYTSATAVPEPESLALVLAGLGLIGVARRRARSKSLTVQS